ncbi:MAG TPA: hypothetical protein VFR03_09925 [Thermoanaerobaculia bacterium]|nr:hypothetical protein [Thermoanaerobaculia bacterium]
MEEYTRPQHVELMMGANRALQALRKRRLEEGYRELQAVEALFHAAEGATAREVHHVLGRWYYGLLAYYFYCIEDYSGADTALDRGHEEVRQAVEKKRFLLPYAIECYEFWLQRIRIARNQRLWPEVWRRVEIARRIATGEQPCCVLSDGSRIDVMAVRAFYVGLEDLTERERQPLWRFLDETAIQRQFRSILSEIYAMPGFVIPYTPGHVNQ